MFWSKKRKEAFFARGLRPLDIGAAVLAVLLFFFCFQFRMPVSEALAWETEIFLGYSAKQGPDGSFYVLDDSHERLLCFGEQGKVRFSIRDPFDDKSDLLYMDDFFVAPEGIYVAATQWDEMTLAREVILFYDKSGNYVKTVKDWDYAELPTNKHRIFGLSKISDQLLYLRCEADCIWIGNRELPYDNAFHAVSDAVFTEDGVYILDKRGLICAYGEQDPAGTVIYDASKETGERIEPYRLAADRQGNLYFTDIRNRQVRKLAIGEERSRVVSSVTGSLTVNLTEEGELLLLDEGGLTVAGEDETRSYLTLEKSAGTVLFQLLWLLSLIFLVLSVFFVLFRLIYYLSRRSYSMSQMISIWVLATVIVVSVLLCSMLMNSFAGSYRNKIGEQVKSAAYMIAGQISGKDIRDVETTGGFGGEAYNRLCRTMEESFSQDVDFYRQIYCNILKLAEDGETGYAVAYLDQSVGAYFPLDEVEQEELKQVYAQGKAVWNQEVNDISGTYLSVKVPVWDEAGGVCGAVAVGVETYVITDTVRAMLTGILASIAILLMLVWLVTVEAMSFAGHYDRYRKQLAEGKKAALPGHLARLLIFLVFTAYNMTATFLPVYLMRRAQAFSGTIGGILGTLPLTVNLFLIGLMSLFCAGLVQNFGIRKIMFWSAICSLGGNLCIFLFPGYWAVFAGLILDGIGVGLITNAVYVMLTYIKDEEDRTWGLTIYNGACLSGINFGMMLGAMLAVFAGQDQVFAMVAASWGLMILLTGYMLRQLGGMLGDGKTEKEEKSGIGLGSFVLSRPVFSFIALIQNPYIIFGSFVFYYVPVYCDLQGYSETICSILIMLYSQAAVLGSSGFTRWVSRMFGKYAMYLALGMNIGAMLLAATLQDMTGMVLALLLMGAGAAFGKPVQQNYYLNLKKTKQYGEDKAMGIYNFTENIGESLGPAAFGRMLAFPDFYSALRIFSGAATAAGTLHYLLSGKERKDGKG